jgi:hypothetical protein
MATIRSSGTILGNIEANLADNNAGLISAADVRNNMADTLVSINQIVASGDTDDKWPFVFDVRAQTYAGSGGTFIAESGIIFPNSPVSTERQVQPFLGVGNLQHNDLGGLTNGDPHTQYVSISGIKSGRSMTGNLAMANYWIGSEGNDQGLKFSVATTGVLGDDIEVSGTFIFRKDNSKMDSAHGVAKAWLSFTAGEPPTLRGYHNIDALERIESGVYKVTFTSGTFLNNNYAAIGISNGLASSGTYDAMEPNSVGITLREGDDGTTLRSLHFKTEQDDGDAVEGAFNDLVVYGYSPGSTSGTPPTVS